VGSASEVLRNWEAIKREQEGRSDPLAGIPSALPALQLAAKLQKRVGDTDFAWPQRERPAAKVGEALEEVMAAEGAEQLERGVGDLLFAVVALARERGVEPEAALRRAARRFRASYEDFLRQERE
jgi:nucleoside triphosphate diphosphatase